MHSDRSRSPKGKWRRTLVCLRCINGHQARDRSPPPAIGDATQSHRHRRGREQKGQPVICWLILVQPSSATGRAAQDGRTGSMLLLPVTVVAAARGLAQSSTLRLYQCLVGPFQRRGKTYELRCGQLSARTIAAFADRRYACRAGEIQHLADTHAWHRSSQEAEVRPF